MNFGCVKIQVLMNEKRFYEWENCKVTEKNKYEIGIAFNTLICDVSAFINDNVIIEDVLLKESVGENNSLPDDNKKDEINLLYTIITKASDDVIKQIKNVLTDSPLELQVLNSIINAIRTKTGKNFTNAFDSDIIIDDVGEMLDSSIADTTFYEILVLYIVEAGYKKVSDFYNKLNIDHRYWHRYKKGFIPPKKKVIEMIIYLQLDYEDAEYLLNIGGMSLQRNLTQDLIIMYFFKNGYLKKMTPEKLMILIDEVLINFNQEPLYSEL